MHDNVKLGVKVKTLLGFWKALTVSFCALALLGGLVLLSCALLQETNQHGVGGGVSALAMAVVRPCCLSCCLLSLGLLLPERR